MAISNTNTGWINDDTMRVKFAQDELVKGTAGEFNMLSSTHVTEFELTPAMVNLGTSDTAPYVLDFDTVFPNGSVINKIELIGTTTTWDSAGDAGAVNMGLVKRSDFATIVDADGLINSLADDAIVAGDVIEITVGSTGAGALLGTALEFDSVICVYVETENITAGTEIKVRLHWRTPAI